MRQPDSTAALVQRLKGSAQGLYNLVGVGQALGLCKLIPSRRSAHLAQCDGPGQAVELDILARQPQRGLLSDGLGFESRVCAHLAQRDGLGQAAELDVLARQPRRGPHLDGLGFSVGFARTWHSATALASQLSSTSPRRGPRSDGLGFSVGFARTWHSATALARQPSSTSSRVSRGAAAPSSAAAGEPPAAAAGGLMLRRASHRERQHARAHARALHLGHQRQRAAHPRVRQLRAHMWDPLG